MNAISLVKGLRAARLDRVLDALEGRAAVQSEPRPRLRQSRRGLGAAQPPQLGLRFLPTV